MGLATLAGVPSLAQQTLSPEGFYNSVMRDGGLQKQGEDFCWHAAYYIGNFRRAYQAYQDTAWLDQGVRYYEFVASKLLTGPDGYQGWIGPYEYDNSVWCDVHVGDAILCNGMVAFAEVVLADPKLRSRYGAIEVAQYSADGKRKIAVLRQADQQWFLFYRWIGAEPGTYRIRWTFEGGGYRDALVVCIA